MADVPATLAGLRVRAEEILSVTVAPPSLAFSARRTVDPVADRITTAASYGLDRMESEGTQVKVDWSLLQFC